MSENNERFEDLKDAYVLDALPVEERRSFEEYLVAHPERQAEIDEAYRQTPFSSIKVELGPSILSRTLWLIFFVALSPVVFLWLTQYSTAVIVVGMVLYVFLVSALI